MSEEQTDEPLKYGEDNDGWYVEYQGEQIAFGLSEKAARRIVACVNAAVGISTDALETVGKDLFDGETASLIEQRDDLLLLAKRVATALPGELNKLIREAKELLAGMNPESEDN